MKDHRKILWMLLLVIGLSCSVAAAAPVKIAGVPDWNQPATYGAAPDSFVQPLDGPPQGAPNGVAGWCTPTAASNMMGWLEDQKGYAGLADGIAYNAVPNRQQPYPNNGVLDGVPDWPQNKWLDGTIEMGYQMDTQGWLKGVAHGGTNFGLNTPDCPAGLSAYLNLYYPAEQWTVWQYDIFNGAAPAASWNDYLNGGTAPVIPALATVPNDGVLFDSSPVLVTLEYWVNPGNLNKFIGDGTEWYDWTSFSPGAHTVIGIGYALNFDPDGAGLLPNGNWLIAHDGWGTTGTDVAVPWDVNFETNIWWANTHVIPEPATIGLLLVGGLAMLIGRKHS